MNTENHYIKIPEKNTKKPINLNPIKEELYTYAQLKAQADQINEELTEKSNYIKKYFADADTGIINNETIATLTTPKPSNTLNYTNILKKRPDIIDTLNKENLITTRQNTPRLTINYQKLYETLQEENKP